MLPLRAAIGRRRARSRAPPPPPLLAAALALPLVLPLGDIVRGNHPPFAREATHESKVKISRSKVKVNFGLTKEAHEFRSDERLDY